MRMINLLPQTELKELQLELASHDLIKFFVGIFATLVIFIAAGFSASLLIRSEIAINDSTISQLQTQLNTSDNQALQKEIVNLNAQIKNVKTLNDQHYYWSQALLAIANLSPADFHYDLVTADRTTGQIAVTGVADNRSSVLAFWSAVRNSPYFQNINFPLNNLEKPTDTPFTFSFNIKPQAIQKPQ